MSRTDRNRLAEFREALDLRDRDGPAQTQRMAVVIYNGGSIPTSVPAVFLSLPVIFDAPDIEGTSYTMTADGTVSIPIVVIGPRVPAAGDLLVAHAIGGRWVAGDDTSGPTGPPPVSGTCCLPALIPQVDLTFAWESSHGNGSTTMFYDGTNWITGCSGIGGDEQFSLTCAAGIIFWSWTVFSTPDDCPDGAVVFGCTPPIDLTTVSNSPFKLVLTNMHDWCGHNAESLGYTKWTVTGPSTTDAGCCVPFLVNGCNGLPLANSGVTVKSGATIIGSGTTTTLLSVLGQIPVDIGTAGTYDVVVTNGSRFTATTFAGELLTCRTLTTLDISSSIATGYHCFTGCAQPAKDTLHATFSVAGVQTLTYASGAWTSSFTASGHAYVVTLNPDGTMTITRDGTDCGTVTLAITACPPSFAGNFNIPAGNCATELGSLNASLTE